MKLTIEKERNNEVLVIEDATQEDILPGTEFFRNFSGDEKRNKTTGQVVNSAGRRNFCLALNLPDEALDELASLGLDIVELQKTNDEYDDGPLRFVRIQITDSGNRPSLLYSMNDKKMTKHELKGKKIDKLDGARFAKAVLNIRTWHKDNGKTSLYLNSGYFWLQRDPIDEKFAEYDEVLSEDYQEDEIPFV